MIDFLKIAWNYFLNNWRWLVPLVLEVIALLVLLFKRKVKINDLLSKVILKIPDFINSAEKEGLSGKEKFRLVFSACISLVCSLTGEKPAYAMNVYGALITDAIESILSTPQKKEK